MPRWEWIATASELPGVGLVFLGVAHRAQVMCLNGCYVPTQCRATAMAMRAPEHLPRCPKCLGVQP